MDWCKFSHKIARNNDNDDTKKLEEKLHTFEDQLKKKDDTIRKLESEIDISSLLTSYLSTSTNLQK